MHACITAVDVARRYSLHGLAANALASLDVAVSAIIGTTVATLSACMVALALAADTAAAAAAAAAAAVSVHWHR